MKDDWHPYPAEKPPEYGFYLTCRKFISVQRHSIYWWNPARSAFYRDCEKVTDVAAWMRLPEPYEGLVCHGVGRVAGASPHVTSSAAVCDVCKRMVLRRRRPSF